ncbi:SDR family NAD(P)-dependent oxidoreductase [Lacisediminimonas profundi]|uniref:SDR family NAD(P)-dependent oxidoreductase n=1 Tax=Lacisediminimonas profundi TaxID=2603856 RepID=UPI00124B4997|nr:SDR family oxidoreductase [Lacisediminimonas profundi]
MEPAIPRYAVVTGAAGGIGQAIVREFTQAGYSVIATDIAEQPAGLRCSLYLQVDLARTVSDEAYAQDVFYQIKAHLGPQGLTTLINNAAIQILGSADSLTRDDWHKTLDVNLLAPFLWTQGLLPELERSRGSVVNISSIHARLTKKNFVAYATSKAALSGMTRSMAVDLGPRVRINAIEPAAIATDMLIAGFDDKSMLFRELEACHPLNRIGSTQEVASCALAMVQGMGEFLHGACISLDGGIGVRLFDPI